MPARTQSDKVARASEALAESVRTLNHLTLQRDVLTPPEVYRVITDLAIAVDRLPQLLNQLGTQVAEFSRGEVYSDRGADYTHVDELETLCALTDASDALAYFAAGLARAREAASHLGYRSAA